jgi:8-oxo-dGTP diphosphatase
MVIATVAAIITRNDKTQFLLTRRGIPPFKGYWCLPGGHIDRYETVQEAVIREVEEETGLVFLPKSFGYFDEIMPEHGIHAVVLVFEGLAQGDLKAQIEEVDEIRWFSSADIEQLPLAYQHRDILKAYINNPKD